MKRKDKIWVALIIVEITCVFIGLEVKTICLEKTIRQMQQNQEQINALSYQRNEDQDRKLRLLQQDVEINTNILISGEFVKDEE